MRMPARMAHLPANDKGYPVPFFAAVIDGKPDIRVISAAKFHRCVKENLCWICGDRLGDTTVFVITEAAALAQVTYEPPCHPECGAWALTACPFVSDPTAMYRNGKPHPGKYGLYSTRQWWVQGLRNAWPAGTILLGWPVTEYRRTSDLDTSDRNP